MDCSDAVLLRNLHKPAIMAAISHRPSTMPSGPTDIPLPLRGLETDAALRAILQGTAMETGERFFSALVHNLAKALNTHGAWITEYFPERRTLRALAFWMDGQWIKNYEVDIAGSPCEQVIDTRELVHFPDRLLELFPHEPEVKALGVVSYMGAPLLDVDGNILGHMAVIDRRPMPDEPCLHAIFRIFAARAAGELQRLRAEADVREREEKVGRLLSSAMDAIIELDDQLRISRVNPATEKVFRCPAGEMIGRDLRLFLGPEDGRRLLPLIAELDRRAEGQRSLWIPGGLTAHCPGRPILSRGSYPVPATTCSGQNFTHGHSPQCAGPRGSRTKRFNRSPPKPRCCARRSTPLHGRWRSSWGQPGFAPCPARHRPSSANRSDCPDYG